MSDSTLYNRLQDFIESEARSCSMDPGCVTPEYVYRMWGGRVPLEEICAVMDQAKGEWANQG